MSKRLLSVVLVFALLLASLCLSAGAAEPALAGDELGGIRYEFENGTPSGNASPVWNNTSVFSDFGGEGYLYIMDGGVSLEIDVPRSGNYAVYTVSGSTDGAQKCDYISINNGPQFLTAAPAVSGVWHTGAIGTEAYDGSTVVPAAVNGGHFLKKGLNTVTLTANWGYAAYDSLIIVPLNTDVYRYELEYGELIGSKIMNNSNLPGYYGTGFVDMWGAANAVGVSLDFDVPESGYYQLMVRSYQDTQANRGESVILNGDEATKLYVATPLHPDGGWADSPIGPETWVDGVMHSPNPAAGYYLEAGVNNIKIMSMWSYGKYDSLILQKMSPVQTGQNDFTVELECGQLGGDAEIYNALEGASFSYVGMNTTGSITTQVSLPYAGYYHIYVRSYNTDGNANRCDKVFINDGEERFFYIANTQANQWVNAPVSDAVYGGPEVEFVPPEGGYYLEKENTITISTNYGYNCVDQLIFVPVPALHLSEDVSVKDQVITVEANTDAALFIKQKVIALKGEIQLLDAQDAVITPRYIGSGMKVRLVADGQTVAQYSFLTRGDLNGDGQLNILDAVLARKSAAGMEVPYSAAGDMDGDQALTAGDIIAMKQIILGKQ